MVSSQPHRPLSSSSPSSSPSSSHFVMIGSPTMKTCRRPKQRTLLLSLFTALSFSLVLGHNSNDTCFGSINTLGFVAMALPTSRLLDHQRVLASHSVTTQHKHDHEPRPQPSRHQKQQHQHQYQHQQRKQQHLHNHHNTRHSSRQEKKPHPHHHDGHVVQTPRTHLSKSQRASNIAQVANGGGGDSNSKVSAKRQSKQGLDVYQERFLNLASRVSGKSPAQVSEMVAQSKESIEWDSKNQEALEKADGMFAHYIDVGKGYRSASTTTTAADVVASAASVPSGKIKLEEKQEQEPGSPKNGRVPVDRTIGSATTDSSMVGYAWVPATQAETVEAAAAIQKHAQTFGLNEDGTMLSLESTGGPVRYTAVPKATPTIFYVPHQDDDALAMALSIREHVESGRRVIVHLYSDGINPLLRDIVAGDAADTIPSHHPPHKIANLTLDDEVTGRTHEFRNSLRALGVKDEDILETGWSDVEPYLDYMGFKKKLRNLVISYEDKYPGASHKCISGEYDRDSTGRNPTHLACWDVATQLVKEHPGGWPSSKQLWDFRFYRTYTYYKPSDSRTAQYIRSLPQYLDFKQRALDQYKRYDPSQGELAWGYHSVQPLIDASYHDPLLYIDMLDNDPTNPENWVPKDQVKKREQERRTRENPETAPGEVTYVEQQQRRQEQKERGEEEEEVDGEDQDAGRKIIGDRVLIEQPVLDSEQKEHHEKGDGGLDLTNKEEASRDAFLHSFVEALKKPQGLGYKIKIGLPALPELDLL